MGSIETHLDPGTDPNLDPNAVVEWMEVEVASVLLSMTAAMVVVTVNVTKHIGHIEWHRVLMLVQWLVEALASELVSAAVLVLEAMDVIAVNVTAYNVTVITLGMEMKMEMVTNPVDIPSTARLDDAANAQRPMASVS